MRLLTLLALVLPLSLAQTYTVPPSGNISISTSSNGDGLTSVVSNIPLICVAGCSRFVTDYLRCNASTPNTVYCGPFCDSQNFTGWTQCLECVTANGLSEFLMKPIPQVLDDSNDLCESVVGDSFTAVATLTASPTTTAPLSESLTQSVGQTYITITPWEGLAPYANASFWQRYNNNPVSSTVSPSGTESAATTSGAASRQMTVGGSAGGVGLVAFVMGLALG